jgi:hypothetical protein
MPLISSGILLAIFSGILGALVNENFLSNVNIGALLNIPLPKGFNLSTSLLFEIAIFLSVLGSISYILSALGHPRISDTISQQEVEFLDQIKEKGSIEDADPGSVVNKLRYKQTKSESNS